MDITNQIHGASFVLAVFLTSLVWYFALKIYTWFLKKELRDMAASELPVSMEDIEHSRNLERAVYDVELRRRDLKIAEQKLAVAEANAKVENSLSRIDQLNHQIESEKIETAGRKARKNFAEVGSDLKPAQ
jgi:hypothetical protein